MKTTGSNKAPLKPRWNPRVEEWDLENMKVGDERTITESIQYFRTLVSRKFRQWGWKYATWTIESGKKPAILMRRIK